MSEFTLPEFLQGQSPEELYEEIKALMPKDIDTSWGSHPYNYTYPTAYLVSMFIQMRFTEAIKMIFPQYCQGYDEIAEAHGETRGIERKAAIKATGTLEITAEQGAKIPYNSQFATISINDTPSVYFVTTDEEVVFDEAGTKTVNIEAVEAGSDGNVDAHTINIIASSITGITNVTNPEALTNGMDEEDLDDYINRMEEFNKNQGSSFIGNLTDYERWAVEASDEVGKAKALEPTEDDGIITLIITDRNGNPASESIRADVYNHIMDPTPLSVDGTRTEDEITGIARLSPPNAFITVISPTAISLSISASIKIDEDVTTLETVQTSLYKAVKNYLIKASECIYISQIGGLITAIDGVIDYDMDTLQLNGQTENILIDPDTQYVIDDENSILLTAI